MLAHRLRTVTSTPRVFFSTPSDASHLSPWLKADIGLDSIAPRSGAHGRAELADPDAVGCEDCRVGRLSGGKGPRVSQWCTAA